MTPPNPFENGPLASAHGSSRRRFIKGSSAIGFGTLVGLSVTPSSAQEDDSEDVLIWALYHTTKANYWSGNTVHPTPGAAIQEGKGYAGAMLSYYNSIDEHKGPKGDMEPCYEIEFVDPEDGENGPIVTAVQVTGGFIFQVNIPKGKFKVIYYKD